MAARNPANRPHMHEMTRIGKRMGIGLGLLVGLGVLGAGLWLYLMSNVEQPRYGLVMRDGPVEVRDYPAMVVAEVTRAGDRGSAVRAGFRPLAAYIFARDRGGESVSMTAPVTQQRETIAMTAPVTQMPARSEAGEAWIVRFIMPSKYTLETLPKAAGDDVRLLPVPAARRAAIRFSGVATDELIASNEAALRIWLAGRGFTILGAPTYAYYNDPFTPGFLRRNEVLFEVAGP
ncbi:heme-binding protein [Phreatobacter sp.]|uniref:SOUL family heme-binding protein n=1 Tax=Phreatobacter sp. TaxID=1966341 RepID=UPI0025DCF472|nr:heme-binding protein [Phreatobacter sp.]